MPSIHAHRPSRLILTKLVLFALGAAGAGAVAAGNARTGDPARPNILIIVADDLGWADVGYHGSSIPTPNLDRLAREGVRLEQFYVAPVCSPTRAALLTGRYWSRFGVTTPINERAFPWNTETLARALKSVGYRTGITGKWHLGSRPEWGPRKFGFDRSYGALAGGVTPRTHRYKNGPFTQTWHRDDALIEEEGHVTDLIAAEAARFLEDRRDEPFFLYVPFSAVHHPLDEPKEWVERGRKADPERPQYAACTMHMDDAIGRLVETLDRTGRRKNTLLIFHSDNGAMATIAGDNQLYPGEFPKDEKLGRNTPLRGHKTQLWEGGIRVPALVSWPEILKPGRVAAPLHVVDWMPTLCRLGGYRPARDLKWDGQDVWPVIAGERSPAARTLYWVGPGRRSSAIRRGDWKLVVQRSGAAQGKDELFDLAVDAIEARNLASEHPERAAELRRLLAEQEARDNDAVAAERE